MRCQELCLHNRPPHLPMVVLQNSFVQRTLDMDQRPSTTTKLSVKDVSNMMGTPPPFPPRDKPLPEVPRQPEPAEPSWDPLNCSNVRVSNPSFFLEQRLQDGIWLCCNGHENGLIHWKGPHPFEHLQCKQCDHIICGKCCSADILIPEPKSVLPMTLQSEPAGGVWRNCRVCFQCGLSHQVQNHSNY